MIEIALCFFEGDKAKAARFTAWTTPELKKTPVSRTQRVDSRQTARGVNDPSSTSVLCFVKTPTGWIEAA